MQSDENVNLIDIFEVAKLLTLSVEAIRKYKRLCLIEPITKAGRKDLYSEEQVLLRKYLIEAKKSEGLSLTNIAQYLEQQKGTISLWSNNKDAQKQLVLFIANEQECKVLDGQIKEWFTEQNLSIICIDEIHFGVEFATLIKPLFIFYQNDLEQNYYKMDGLEKDLTINNAKPIPISDILSLTRTEFQQKLIELEKKRRNLE